MEIDTSVPIAPKDQPTEHIPEVDIYLRLLILHHLIASPETHSQAMQLAQETVQKMQELNRRSMDPIAAKIWSAVERTYEVAGELGDARS